VWGSPLGGGINASPSCVPEPGEVVNNPVKPEVKVPGDVLDGDEPRATLIDDPPDGWPEVPGVMLASACAGDREGLAWITGSNASHSAAERSSIEGVDIGPYRRRIQLSRRHASRQNRDCREFPLHVQHRSSRSAQSSAESEVETSDSGAKRDGGQ